MSNKNEYIDRRIVKSKKAMKDAILSLMQDKDFKEISISDIVRAADLNRGTFYKHYQYKEDLLNELIDEVIADLVASFREPYKDIEILDVKNLTTSAVKVFDHVQKYSTFYSLIVSTSVLAGFQQKFCEVLKELTLNDLNESIPNSKVNRELHASYQAYAILGLIIEWIQGNFKYSSSYMAEQLLEILKHNKSATFINTKN
ncbi:TetR/AcrR family transcriptional regulator [Metabacillus litoralis]|uniref:TetR/AcrR family transcriptional regulator n=1 Tax=Metabacillus litoralis TaxID=152268 RepID=UPI001CFD1C35|nr:TetR/AcrR family transcriptional regulator [Metabacillus litoralis]